MHAHCVRAVADWAQSRLIKPGTGAGGAHGKSPRKGAAAAEAAAPLSREEAAAEAAGVPYWTLLLRALQTTHCPTAVTLSPSLLQAVVAAASGCVEGLGEYQLLPPENLTCCGWQRRLRSY
jgi:hypothetical protein